ncbi:DUF6093 family protein [Micromonospora sp. NPDC048986]|uniref:DUF6093 family protein n=1 Tax=Micromonospora sp. NPDC048986 TaxID=3155644 RepID=UPI0033C7BF3C
MPLRNTRVIHPAFEAHHRPVSESGMTAECRITRPSSGPATWDDATGQNTYPAPMVVYEGICRVHRGGPAGGSEASARTVADRVLALGQYDVTISTAADLVKVNDIVTITACQGDPDLIGLPLQVTGARRSALTWERVLAVQMQQPTTR